MESDDDYQLFSAEEEPSSPIHKRKLKRLKRATPVSRKLTAQFVDPTTANGSHSTSDAHHDSLETRDLEKTVDPSQPVSESEGFDNGDDSAADQDGVVSHCTNDAHHEFSEVRDNEKAVDLIQPKFGSEGFGTGNDSVNDQDGIISDRDRMETGRNFYLEEQAQLNTLDVPNDESDGKGDDQSKDLGKNDEVLNTNKVMNEQKCSDGEEKDGKKNKKKRSKSGGDNGKLEAPARTKKRIEKERKIYVEGLHVETQRLLRETRDASFKPIPLVQKPISSVLEKIRKRKLEISKKASILNSYSETDHSSRETMVNICPDYTGREKRINDKNAGEMERDLNLENEEYIHLEGASVSSSSDPASPSDQRENVSSNMALDEELKITFRDPINDTQDLFCGSEPFDEEDMQPDSPLVGLFAPSLLTMNLKLDSAPPEEISSDDEGDDKENMDPQPHKLVNEDICTENDPVKAFVDDEAEEEDDSDNDPMHSQENEEDEENEESEEFNDLIESGYQEKAIDNEKRDQLHQKWLEQQDAAATENVLQRIKCGLKQREANTFEEMEEEEFDENSVDEGAVGLLSKSIAPINSKKVKQMIPQMFNDKDDVFVSDDEEAEQNLVRQRLLEKADVHGTFLSPAEDESSREVFGLIKKLNIVPDTKKKAKSSSYLDKLITGGSSNSSSKFSFLGRVSSNSLSASNKHGSRNFRSFIFERDDSNSRSGVSTTEVSPDMDERGSQPKRNASAKFSNSQSKISSQCTVTSETSSGSSLLEVLRRSSLKSDQKQNSMVGQTQAVIQFAAFKSRKKLVKMESRA